MQKKLIALAVAGLVSGGAFAQSNVTVYGVADATFEAASATGAVNGGANLANRSRVNSNSSLIGFKGTEALGNGLTALFQIETAVTVDAGGSAGVFGNARDTFVGLKSDSLGTVTLGTQTGPSRALGAAIDLNSGATGPGANSSLIGKSGGSGAGVFDTRFGNSIAYTSPTFAGFNAVAAYVATENTNNQTGTATATVAGGYGYDLGAFYNNGPIFAGLTYGRLDLGADGGVPTNTDYQSLLRLAGAYQVLPALKLTALYEQNKVKTFASDVKQNIWGLGAKFNVTSAGAIIGQYYQAQNTSGAANNDDTGARLYEVGYEHSLSKRTILKASYNRIDNKDRATYDFNIGAVGNTTIGAAAAGSNPQVIAVGLRHSF